MLLSDFGLPSNLEIWLALLLLALSLVIGMLGGLIGLSLGTMRLPAMLMLGVPLPIAASANIFVSSVVGVTGSYRHFRDGRVKLILVAIVGVPAFAAGFLGGYFSNQAPTNLLIALAGCLILWQGVELVLMAYRQATRRTLKRNGRRSTRGFFRTVHNSANHRRRWRQLRDRIAGRRHRPGAGFRQAPADNQGAAG